jgi:hypothetical protein
VAVVVAQEQARAALVGEVGLAVAALVVEAEAAVELGLVREAVLEEPEEQAAEPGLVQGAVLEGALGLVEAAEAELVEAVELGLVQEAAGQGPAAVSEAEAPKELRQENG